MMNYYRVMNKENLQIDFASTNDPCDELKQELAQNGSKYFDLGSRKYSPMHYMKKLATVLKMEKYDVIHVNGNSSTMAMELVTAKLVGVPSRIAHVHTTRSKYPYANVVLHPIFATSYTTALAVSKQAGDWLYGKNYTLLNNAINTAKYKFNVDVREKMRKKYELTGKFVIGTVGKLNPPKNHIHLLQTFAEYSKKDETAMLVIAGGGELEQHLKQQNWA
jgi:glycosyltransferase involved in cell wall biosynthesis